MMPTSPQPRLLSLSPAPEMLALLYPAPSTDRGEVMVGRIGEPDAPAFHDHGAGWGGGRKLVQVRAPEIVPGLLQVAHLVGEETLTIPALSSAPFQVSATSRLALRSRNVNVS